MGETPADYAQAGFAGLTSIALIAFAMAFVDADAAYFDPRPPARRALAATHQGVVHAGHDINYATAACERHVRALLFSAALTLAAVLALCTSTEATR